MYAPIIQVLDFLQLLDSENVVVIDASNGKDAKLNYEANHIKGALFFDLNTHLAQIPTDFADGGRHPLPKIEDFAKTLSHFGITKKSHIVVYDDKNGANAAARLWWMLRAIGHDKVQVLDGGIQEAHKHNLPMSSKLETYTETVVYEVDGWKLNRANSNDVESFLNSQTHLIVDVREASRFSGDTEPIDLVAGHIPSAINIPFTQNLDANGLFFAPDILKEKYEAVFGNINTEKIVFHCGSGVTACHSLLAIAYAGLDIPSLYVGSWSEWSRSNKPKITK